MQGFQNIQSLAAGLRAGDFSSVELTQALLTRIGQLDSAVNAFISITEEAALNGAKQADAALAKGTAGPLCGIPIAHKDLFCTAGELTTCASKMLANFTAPYSATVVDRLQQAGMVMLGKTNMDEFAMGSSNETSHFGPCHNPWDLSRVPGGSSGGSAAAVAAGFAPVATGTDTGGSIRQPAAYCGVSGIKPTYGRVSRYGMVAFASSLDQAGVFGRDVNDLALVLGAMSGFDARDSTSSEQADSWLEGLSDNTALNLFSSNVGEPANGTIGLPVEYFADLGVGSAELEAVRQQLEGMGYRCVDVSLPHTDAAIPAYYVIAGAEASTNLSRYDGVRFGHRCENPQSLEDLYERSRGEGFGSEVKRRILTGTYALSVGYYDAYYVKAQKVRRLIQQDFLTAFNSVDLILAPVAPTTAFAIGGVQDPVSMYQQDKFTIPASLAGLPAMSLPCGMHEGLPLGLQLIAPHFHERQLLECGARYQQQSDWHTQQPPQVNV